MNNTLTLSRPRSLWQWLKIYYLYRTAFPRSEQKPFSMVVKMTRSGKTDTWYCSNNGKFIGLAITINDDDTILLDYFATTKQARNHGYGSTLLQKLIAKYSPKTMFVEIETVFENAEDLELRKRRKQFYLRNGLTEMGVMVYLFDVKMELLTSNRSMTFEEYRNFYKYNYNEWAAEHILPAEHPYDIGGEA